MEAKTTIGNLFQGRTIAVPQYQRAYSWDTPQENDSRKRQVDVFLTDLLEHIDSEPTFPYYLGHFLFEQDPQNKDHFWIIDGQQRLTSTVIFVQALIDVLSEQEKKEEQTAEGDGASTLVNFTWKNGSPSFGTVEYDYDFFADFVYYKSLENTENVETESQKRIAEAYQYFHQELSNLPEDKLKTLYTTLSETECTTDVVQSETRAIQSFIFHNNRGKAPTNLEVVKARFMFHVHLYGGNRKTEILRRIRNKFEKIYYSISTIEGSIKEDNVLNLTLRVYFDNLTHSGALDSIDRKLKESKDCTFIEDFVSELDHSFKNLRIIYSKDRHSIHELDSLLTLSGINLALPFLLKAYKFKVSHAEIATLSASLESIMVRHKLIGTRAKLGRRLKDKFKDFKGADTKEIEGHIQWLRTEAEGWSGYWNQGELEMVLRDYPVNRNLARFILWKYENKLLNPGKKGYDKYLAFEKIVEPAVEHIAPQAKPKEVAHGYCDYDPEFYKKYLDSLGNYLLISKPHNSSIGNKPFMDKYEEYDYLEQQKEVQELAKESKTWTKEMINRRKEELITFIKENF